MNITNKVIKDALERLKPYEDKLEELGKGGVYELSPEGVRMFINLMEEVLSLRQSLEWLLNLAHGVSKDGGEPTSDEWNAAWKSAQELLENN